MIDYLKRRRRDGKEMPERHFNQQVLPELPFFHRQQIKQPLSDLIISPMISAAILIHNRRDGRLEYGVQGSLFYQP